MHHTSPGPEPPTSALYPALDAEKKPALRLDQALIEADRCLFCYDAPCTRACPTHIDVPRFIKMIASGNLPGAARTILSANILGASCARVCPTEVLCEGACVLTDVYQPIAIGQLQRHATDHAFARGLPAFVAGPRRPGTVGIVGAGPAGLACAAELLSQGYESVIYEASERPGGLNTYGVAQYKMTPGASLAEVEWLVRSGVQIRCGVRVGKDVTLAELEQRHDAIFLGVGMAEVPGLGLPGEELPGVFDALDLIADLKLGRPTAVPIAGARVAVLGGGNTAIDVATQTARAGAAEVWLVYRRGFAEMSAYAHEVHLAAEHGTRMVFHTVPLRILGQGRVQGLEVSEVRPEVAARDERVEAGTAEAGPTGPGQSERMKARLVPVPGTTRLVPVDAVVRATGQKGAALLRPRAGVAPEVRSDSVVVPVDAEGRTSNPRYWAGGDCVSGGKEVVNAVAEGKRAARGIIREILSHVGGPGTEVN